MEENQEMEDVWLRLAEEHNIENLLKFSEIDIHEKLMENSWQIAKFTELFQKEDDKLNQIIVLKDKIVGKRYDHYRFNFDKELKQSEIEKYYLPKDDHVIKINGIIRKQQFRVNFFAMVVKALDKLQWNMSNFGKIDRSGR